MGTESSPSPNSRSGAVAPPTTLPQPTHPPDLPGHRLHCQVPKLYGHPSRRHYRWAGLHCRCFLRTNVNPNPNPIPWAAPLGGQACDVSAEITPAQFKALAVMSAIPMIGFGFVDNFVMVVAGDAIDTHIGPAQPQPRPRPRPLLPTRDGARALHHGCGRPRLAAAPLPPLPSPFPPRQDSETLSLTQQVRPPLNRYHITTPVPCACRGLPRGIHRGGLG